MYITRGPQDPCTSEEVELHMDLGMVREFEINIGRQYFFFEALFNDSNVNSFM